MARAAKLAADTSAAEIQASLGEMLDKIANRATSGRGAQWRVVGIYAAILGGVLTAPVATAV